MLSILHWGFRRVTCLCLFLLLLILFHFSGPTITTAGVLQFGWLDMFSSRHLFSHFPHALPPMSFTSLSSPSSLLGFPKFLLSFPTSFLCFSPSHDLFIKLALQTACYGEVTGFHGSREVRLRMALKEICNRNTASCEDAGKIPAIRIPLVCAVWL